MKKPKIKMEIVSSPIVAHTKKLKQKWVCDFSQEFRGQILRNLKVGKEVIFDCLGPTLFVVDHIEKDKAYLRSNKVCNIAKKVGRNKWETDWQFYSLKAAKQMKMWYK